jgi:hypothetical protein
MVKMVGSDQVLRGVSHFKGEFDVAEREGL